MDCLAYQVTGLVYIIDFVSFKRGSMDKEILKNELKNFLDKQGRLKSYPSKFRLKILSLFYLAAKFEDNKRYSEKEVNELLKTWHTFNDWCMLRRDLYDKGFFGREQNCSYYWLENKQPTLVDFGLEQQEEVIN